MNYAMTAYLTIQSAPRTDYITEDGTELTQLPYPFHVTEDGSILRQDFWRGKPKRVVGFQRRLGKKQIDVTWRETWRDPERAVGMYVVTQDEDGSMHTRLPGVESVTSGDDDA